MNSLLAAALKTSLIYSWRHCLFFWSQEHPLIVPLLSKASCNRHGVLCIPVTECDWEEMKLNSLELLMFFLVPGLAKAKEITLYICGHVMAGSLGK